MSSVRTQARTVFSFFVRPVTVIRDYQLAYLRPDILAGLTIAVVTLPQAMAYALIAELPPQVGLYSAMVGAIVGGLWGSCAQLQTGPTNTSSLLILAVLLTIATPGTPEYVVAAGIMALLVGIICLVMGLARLGVLVNFVSDSVIVGFTAGAGALIFANQIRHLLRLPIPSMHSLWDTLPAIAASLSDTHVISLLIGLGTMIAIVVLRKINRKLPAPLLGMVVAAVMVALFGLDARGARVVGELPSGLPPFSPLPIFDFELVGKLAGGSVTVAAIALVEAISIARSIASKTGQRLDSNQEFVGQGLANIATGFFSGYACTGSFTRSAVNYEAGAKTPLSSVFGSIFVLLAISLLGPLAAYVPLSSLAGVLTLTAYRLIDRHEMSRIWRSGGGDRVIMVVTVIATLALPLELAVLTGIALSLGYYLIQTSTPRVRTVLPERKFQHFVHQPDKPSCPQLGIIEIRGDLYFGAINHVEVCIHDNQVRNPDQRFLLLRMQAVEHCDISGIHALESIVRTYRERAGDVYMVRVHSSVLDLMRDSGFYAYLGEDHLLDSDGAIEHLFYRVIDPAICIYECPVRAFLECQNLPKRGYPSEVRFDVGIAPESVPAVTAQTLWEAINGESPPRVIDVREPREFRQGHIPGARLLPLPFLLNHIDQIPREHPVVIVCRGGRRSTRATALLRDRGYDKAQVLTGGMIAWQGAKLLEAIDRFGEDHERMPST